MPLENAHVDEGDLVKFMAKIVGYPKARVNWFVNKTHAVNVIIFKKIIKSNFNFLNKHIF